jgi:uncharacterized damage-inducible protein DinB
MKPAAVLFIVLGLILGLGGTLEPAFAQAESKPAPGAAPAFNIRAEFLDDLKDLEDKVVSLAEAFPQEKYTWRPAEGVRSVSEVFLHFAGGNFGFPTYWGAQPPAGIERKGFEKSTTDKRKVIELVKQSYDYMRKAAENLSDADLARSVKMFGEETTVSGVLFTVATHQHEHLGQAIAYARMNGVVPPWTAARQAKQQAQPKK